LTGAVIFGDDQHAVVAEGEAAAAVWGYRALLESIFRDGEPFVETLAYRVFRR
jgi:hypothetical protein